VLLDYVDVVVHVFLRDRRQFYALEELWGDADIKYLEEENVTIPNAMGPNK
jgi:ribosome-associated protein